MEKKGPIDQWPEMERLVGGMSSAARGQGRCYGVCGPAGVGKTFLIRRAERTAESLGFAVMECQAEAGTGPRTLLSPLVPSTKRTLTDQQLPPVVIDRLRELSSKKPVLLTLDDLHLAERNSISMLILIARGIADLPAMMIISYDHEAMGSPCGDVHPLMDGVRILIREGRFEELRLERMPQLQLIAMIEADLGSSLDAPLADLIWNRSEGNPLMALEVARLLVQTQQMKHHDGRWTATGPVQMDLPDDRRVMAKHRMELLSPEDRTIMAIAAVAGRTFDPMVIADLQRTDLLDLLERLDRIAHDHKLLEDDGERYRFSTAEVRSVLLDDMTSQARIDTHDRIAKVIESRMMRESPFDDLSEHYYRAERAEKCVCFSLLAGHRALVDGDPQVAIGHFQRVLDAADRGGHEEERRFSMEEMADAEMALGRVSEARSRYAYLLRHGLSPADEDRIRRKMD